MSVGAIDQRGCLVRRKVCKLAFDKGGCFLLRNKPGYQYWFTQADNERLEENNEAFIFHSPEEEMVLTHIRKPERFEKVYYLTVSEIAELKRERTGYQYSIGSKIQLGKVMTKNHFESKKGNNGRRYAVFIIDIEQVKSNRLYE